MVVINLSHYNLIVYCQQFRLTAYVIVVANPPYSRTSSFSGYPVFVVIYHYQRVALSGRDEYRLRYIYKFNEMQ